jgi:hypothetical protein
MTEEDVNTVKVGAVKRMIKRFFDDLPETYHVNAKYADRADELLKSIRAVLNK